MTLVVSCNGPPPGLNQPYAPYTNLQVLPKDITWPDLENAMLANLRGLGLRRTGGEGCLFCHVGSMQTPMETWDFASDVKFTKRNARTMMRMVRTINDAYLTDLEGRDSVETAVNCYTCHQGRTNPRPLLAVLRQSHASGGIDKVEREYRRLHEEYYGGGVYDFRGALIDLGVEFADGGSYADAIRATEIHLSLDPRSVDAHRWLIRLVLERAILAGERDGLRVLFDSLVAIDRPDGAAVWFTLRSVGVRLRNAGRLEEAEAAFVLNEQIYPADHRVITDLAQTRLLRGDTAAAVAGARRALAIDPDYVNAAELLAVTEPGRR